MSLWSFDRIVNSLIVKPIIIYLNSFSVARMWYQILSSPIEDLPNSLIFKIIQAVSFNLQFLSFLHEVGFWFYSSRTDAGDRLIKQILNSDKPNSSYEQSWWWPHYGRPLTDYLIYLFYYGTSEHPKKLLKIFHLLN